MFSFSLLTQRIILGIKRNLLITSKLTRKIRLRAVDWYASALSHTALLPKYLI